MPDAEARRLVPQGGVLELARDAHDRTLAVRLERTAPGAQELHDPLGEIDGERLTDEEVIGFLFLMVVAGNETTTKLLGNMWWWAQREPSQRALAFSDPSRIPGWVEETLRFDTPVHLQARRVARDVELHGRTLREGDKVGLLYLSANRDERKFAHSLRLVFPRITAPAARKRATSGASVECVEWRNAKEPAVVGTGSAVSMLSLIKIGMPCKTPRVLPA